ncbi:MAG: type I-F CRISPR-associated endoribonuclease Cas6/Csy4 [Campylobacterota bacterium]|nr:type I-F CRISPR-associated endoribonuclease Cas6/Csy4 [Campylobacterota bacterium]
MKYYIDIKLLPEVDISLGFLWKKVYQQIHLALVEAKDEAIALSFPGYGDKIFPLGDRLRVFAQNIDDLEALSLDKWLNRLQDYCFVSKIKETPKVDKYVSFTRKQVKYHDDVLKRATHQAKRRDISIEEALKHFEGYKEKKNNLPFIQVKSLSSEQELKLFIEKKELNEEMLGVFNTFGLSKTATIPWF